MKILVVPSGETVVGQVNVPRERGVTVAVAAAVGRSVAVAASAGVDRVAAAEPAPPHPASERVSTSKGPLHIGRRRIVDMPIPPSASRLSSPREAVPLHHRKDGGTLHAAPYHLPTPSTTYACRGSTVSWLTPRCFSRVSSWGSEGRIGMPLTNACRPPPPCAKLQRCHTTPYHAPQNVILAKARTRSQGHALLQAEEEMARAQRWHVLHRC